ncbi:NTP transferase domain-containing protein [Lacisediminihabitans sp. FW035]
MIFDAIVLAGGRASRLGGTPKAELVVAGRSLLSRALDATAGARRVVVVGTPAVVPPGVIVTREVPAYGGPAAAIAAGLGALESGSPADFVLVLACDMPDCAAAVAELLARATDGVHGVVAIDSESHRQPLLGLYRSAPLTAALRDFGTAVEGLSVRALLSDLELAEIAVPASSTEDIDTWEDAAGFGISPTPTTLEPALPTKGLPMSDRDDDVTRATLADWSQRLTSALGVEGAEVDIDAVLALAGTAAHAIMRPAAPLTTYLVGYAAGLAAAASADSAAAKAGFERASEIARGLATGSVPGSGSGRAESGDR